MHLLEHVTVELLALTNLAETLLRARLPWWIRRGLYEIILACPDDMLAAGLALQRCGGSSTGRKGIQEDACTQTSHCLWPRCSSRALICEKTHELADSSEPEADAAPPGRERDAEDYVLPTTLRGRR